MVDLNLLDESQKWALLFGIMAGDGCLSHFVSKQKGEHFIISVTGNYYDDKPFFREIVIPLVIYFRRKNVNIKERPIGGRIDLNFCDKKLFYRIKDAGFPIGKKGPHLIIPEAFYKENLLKYIIQGFFATDGSLVLTKNPNKFYPRIESVVIHKVFLKQIYDYLVSIGLKGAYYKSKSKPDPRWKTSQEKYRIQFNGKKNLLFFDKLIGFVNPKHKKKFDDFIKYDKEYNSTIKGISSLKQKSLREPINTRFINKMATLGVEPRTSCS